MRKRFAVGCCAGGWCGSESLGWDWGLGDADVGLNVQDCREMVWFGV